MAALYPEIAPHEHGMLDVGDGQHLYWESCGDPVGKPAIVLHGGPGSGCTSGLRRYFDPERFRIVLFDQRGAGRSEPHASDSSVDLSTNTTHHLIADIERLRIHLGVERFVVWGLSWGSTLALAYMERHPERVSEAVLAPVTLTRDEDVRWLTEGARRFLPEAWSRFRDGVLQRDEAGDIVAAYDRVLNHDPDPAVRERAARDWCDWEEALVSSEPGYAPNPRYDDPRFRMAFARIVVHYFRHRAWLEEGELLSNAGRLTGIPGVLVQGRFDLAGPSLAAWELAGTWPDATLELVGTGHTGGEEMDERIIAATDRFATT